MRATFILLIRYLLPFHKRQTNRLIWLRVWAQKMDLMMTWIDSYRESVRKELSVTIQIMAFQNHLNNLFDSSLRRILIIHYQDNSTSIGLESEGLTYVCNVGFVDEVPSTYKNISKQGESNIPIEVDYKVIYPSAINQNVLIAELDKYRPAGKTYIVESF